LSPITPARIKAIEASFTAETASPTHYDLIAREGTVDRARLMLSEAALLPRTEPAS